MDSDIGMDPFSLILLQKLTAVGERNLKLEEENARLLTERDDLRKQADFHAFTNHLDPSFVDHSADTGEIARLNALVEDLQGQVHDRDSRLETLQGQVQQIELDRTSLQRRLDDERISGSLLQDKSSAEIKILKDRLMDTTKNLLQKTEELDAVKASQAAALQASQAQQATSSNAQKEPQQPSPASSVPAAASSSTAKASDATSSSKAPTAPIGSSAYLLSRIKAREASVMPPLFATSTHLPQARLDALAKFGLLKVNHADEIVSKIFPRSHIGKCLGGGSQSLIANIDKTKARTTIASIHDVSALLYPKRDLNCWLPQLPGEHGFMFVGLQGPAKDNERFMEAEVRVLFIKKKEGVWQYYGHYQAHRDPNNDLDVSEWLGLTEEFRQGYAACTLSKRMGNSRCDDYRKKEPARHRADVQKIMDDYDAGTLRVPCVTLRCTKYDYGLVASLANGLGSTAGTKRKFDEMQRMSTPRAQKRPRDASDSSSGSDLSRLGGMPDAYPTPQSTIRKSARLQSRAPSVALSEMLDA